MNKTTRIKIRNNVFEKLPENTVSFFFSGMGVRKSADAEYPFSANRNFVYLTGVEAPESVLVMDSSTKKTVLFIRDIDPMKEKWLGYFLSAEAALETSGVDEVRYLSEFEDYVNLRLDEDIKIGVDVDHETYSDEIHGSGMMFAMAVGEENVVNVFDVLVSCRMIKLPEEVEKIKEAGAITDSAIMAALSDMKPGNNERDLAAKFLYTGMVAGGDLMFDTIIAGGANAVVLHYVENDQTLNDGDLVLFDLGIRKDQYGADISRTFPVNGVFSERQKSVYQEVLNCFHAVNLAVRPGISLLDLNELAKEKLTQSCKKLGLISKSEDVDQYYYHSIGHSLGLDTHDVWSDRTEKLVPGNVITNEPGLYIKEWGIGIRIETDLLVTETGCEDLMPQIIREVDEIEAYLKTV